MDDDVCESSELVYRKKHFMHRHKCPPLLNIDPSDWAICTLHLQLAMTKVFFNRGLRPLCKGKLEIAKLNEALKELDVNVK